jgi:transcriptional regulator with XRE-family HTH domain
LTTPVQQAREALGERLREIRKDARLSARAMAASLGWHFTKVSKIENGARSPNEDDIRAWCTACGADDQVPDLIATVRHVASMYHEYRRQMQAGMKHLQESSVPLYEATSLFRIYDTTVVPGLFTTAEYAAVLFRFWQGFMGMKDDIDAAVGARMERQRVLYTGSRTFRVVIEEQVLRTRVGDVDVMAGQLDRLLAVMSLPRVTIGIIPATGDRHSLTQGSFWMFDETLVRIETVSASLTVTQPRDIALYSRVFELLQRSAVHGREARQLITRALQDVAGGLAVNLCQHRCLHVSAFVASNYAPVRWRNAGWVGGQDQRARRAACAPSPRWSTRSYKMPTKPLAWLRRRSTARTCPAACCP